ncbi:MAG: APC family permease [Clostridia bacterium]|nr:APC family permease [Clostridia bacterium]
MDSNKSVAAQPGLKRQLNPMHVWALAFGCVIGWGSFINPGKKFLPNSGVYGTAIAMALGALVMIIIAFSYAYIVPKYPNAGGEFTFTRRCFGKTTAYWCGWFLVAAYLTNVPMNSTAIPLIVEGLFGKGVLDWGGLGYEIAGNHVSIGGIVIAAAILLLFGFLNILGVKKAGFIQIILSSLLVVSVVVLTVAALISSKAQGVNLSPVWGFDKAAAIAAEATTENIDQFAHAGTAGILSAVLATFAIAPWAYVGFDTIPQAAEEFNFSFKKVSFIMVIAILFGCFVYTANNTVAAAALTNWPDRVMAGDWVLLIAAEELLGPFGKILIGVAVSCAVLSGIMGFYLASSRLMYSMARDGYLPQVFAKVSNRNVPRNAIIFCVLISLSGPILGREALGWFVDMSAIGASIGYFFTSAATLRTLRRDKDGTLFLKIMAILGILFSVTFMVLQLVPIPGLKGVSFGTESYVMLGIWIALGLLFYALRVRKFKNSAVA